MRERQNKAYDLAWKEDSISISCAVSMSVFLAVAVSLVVRESAVSWSRSATGPVTMMMRHPSCVSGRGAFGGADGASSVVRVGTITFVTTVTICCDNIFAP